MSRMPTIYFRPQARREEREEVEAAQRHLPVAFSRLDCADRLVVGRYSVSPFYDELESDVARLGGSLINTLDAHRYIAAMDYARDLGDLTPRTWLGDLSRCPIDGPFVVKGLSKSLKHNWKDCMYAADRPAATRVAKRLMEDSEIGLTGVAFREYVPLRAFEVGINGMPFANEWRVFYLDGARLIHGYYWSLLDDLSQPSIGEEGLGVADSAAAIISRHSRFFAVDVAEAADGRWIVIEANEGQSSGLSMIDPDAFYAAIAAALAG